MTNNQKLILLLQNEVIPELEDHMDDLFEKIASNKGAKKYQEELQEVRDLHKDFKEILEDAMSGDMDDDECAEVIEEIMDMFDSEEQG